MIQLKFNKSYIKQYNFPVYSKFTKNQLFMCIKFYCAEHRLHEKFQYDNFDTSTHTRTDIYSLAVEKQSLLTFPMENSLSQISLRYHLPCSSNLSQMKASPSEGIIKIAR